MASRPRGYRTADDVHKALRIRAAETGETIEAILDRALRRELGMMEAGCTWEVIEDNGGGLHLAVFGGDGSVVYFASEYEFDAERLKEDLNALESGDDTNAWDTNGMSRQEMQGAYDDLTAHEHGWQVVADQEGIYPDSMGRAAQLAFGVDPS